MKRTLIALSAAILTFICYSSLAQDRTTSASEDYLRKAYEAIDENDYDKTYDYVSKQLSLTPDNVEALILRVKLCILKKEFRQALVDINRAIKVNKPKLSEIPNSTLHYWKASVYRFMSDDVKAQECLRSAYELSKKDNPDEVHPLGFEYAQSLYEAERLNESDAIYRELLKFDGTDVASMVGLSRSLLRRGKYKEALRQLQDALRIEQNYDETYRFLMHTYDNLGQKNKAIDAAIDYIERAEEPNFDSILETFLKSTNYAVANLRSHIRKSDKPVLFRIILGDVLQLSSRHEEALKEYITLENEHGTDTVIYHEKGLCYKNLGMLEYAIQELTLAIETGGMDYDTYCERGACYRLLGNFTKAISDFTAAIEAEPTESYPYYQRGWCHELSGNLRKALEDYNLGIELNPDYPYLYVQRGLLLKKMGNQDKARKDFEAVLQKDTVATDGSCTQFALAELGREAEAIAWMKKIIAENTSDFSNLYDAACLYARLGRSEEALDALKRAFENGYRNFAHVGYDPDLDSIRELPSFKELVSKHKALHEQRIRSGEIPVPGNTATAGAKDVIYLKS